MAKPYPPEVREKALGLLRGGQPLSQVSEAMDGIPKGTLSRWATEAGVSVVTLRAESAAAATEARAFSYGELVAELQDLLGNIARTGARATLERLKLLMPDGQIDPEALRDEDLAKVVGSWTRAIHDLQLLSGKATERHDLGSDVDRQIEELVEQMAGMDPARD